MFRAKESGGSKEWLEACRKEIVCTGEKRKKG